MHYREKLSPFLVLFQSTINAFFHDSFHRIYIYNNATCTRCYNTYIWMYLSFASWIHNNKKGKNKLSHLLSSHRNKKAHKTVSMYTYSYICAYIYSMSFLFSHSSIFIAWQMIVLIVSGNKIGSYKLKRSLAPVPSTALNGLKCQD